MENLALRQQVTALKKERPWPPLKDTDRAFWVALRDSWPGWASRLVIVKADAVARWHRDRFRRYWAKFSQQNRVPGRPRVDAEIRRLIRMMACDTKSRDRMCEKGEEKEEHVVYPHHHPTRACGLCAVQPVRSLADNVPNWVHTWQQENPSGSTLRLRARVGRYGEINRRTARPVIRNRPRGVN